MRRIILLFALFNILLAANIVEFEDINSSESDSDCNCDTEIYEADQDSGFIKSPNYPSFHGCNGKCVYIIKPHPNKSVSLYTPQHKITRHMSLTIFALFYIGEEKVLLPHALIKTSSYYYYHSKDEHFPSFISAKNVGYEIHFRSLTNDEETSFKISFDRYYDYGELCDHPLVTVTREETVVQREHEFTSSSGCVYYLRADESQLTSLEDEFLIHVTANSDNYVAIRTLDGNGNLVTSEETRNEQFVTTSAYNVQMVTTKSSRVDEPYKLTRITAKLIAKDCLCDTTKYILGSENVTKMQIRSPGYPDLYCPSVDCNYDTSYAVSDPDSNLVALLGVKITAYLGNGDTLKVKNKVKTYFSNDVYTRRPKLYEEMFVLKQQSMNIHYTSGNKYAKRNFEIELTQFMVKPECVCNQYKEKRFTLAANFGINFPSNCTFIFCHFTFSVSTAQKYGLEFLVAGNLEGDVVVIKDDVHTERYEGTALEYVQRYETGLEIEMFFYRDSRNVTNEGTYLDLRWMTAGTRGTCDRTRKIIELPRVDSAMLVSPGYPRRYPDGQVCEYLITKSVESSNIELYISDISLEKYHDHLRIYAGNTTKGELLHEFTGYYSELHLNFTTAPILIVFQTDLSTSDRGFHIAITAYYPDVVESDGHFLKYMLVALVFVIIILALAAVYAHKMGYIQKLVDLKRLRGGQGDGAAGEGETERRIEVLDNQDQNQIDNASMSPPASRLVGIFE